MANTRYWFVGAAAAVIFAAAPAFADEEEASAEAENDDVEEAAEAEEIDEAEAEEAEEAEAEAAAEAEAEEAEEAAAEEAEEAAAEEAAEAEDADEEAAAVEDAPSADPDVAEPEVDPDYEADGAVRLRLYAVTTRNVYERVRLDVYDAETEEMVAAGATTDRARGEAPLSFDLPPGLYRVVRSGDPFDTRTDFATVHIGPDEAEVDYLVVVEPGTHRFRGSGVVTDELPEGVELAGIRMALNAGGTLNLSQQHDVVGQTQGIHGIYGLFGNFSLIFEEGDHFLDVGSDLEVNLLDRPEASVYATRDRFRADALYAYNIENPYIGPYVRGSFRTAVFPSHLFLDSGVGPEEEREAEISVTRVDLEGETEETIFGTKSTQDNLRVRLSDPFSPVVLQQELGANLRALTADLRLLDVDIGTRLGWAFRQGIVRDESLFVVDGDRTGEEIVLQEVDGYTTMGPTVGGTGTVTFARWLYGSGRASVVAPVQNREDAGGRFISRLLVDFSATAGFRVPVLTDLVHASLDYTFRLERDGFLSSDTQIDQNLMGRVNVNIF